MMSVLFTGMIVLSAVFALLCGRMSQLSAAMLSDSIGAVTLLLKILGSMCMWSGLMEIAEECGLAKKLAWVFQPLTKHLFKGLRSGSPALRAISMNLTAGLLGLGNAATPLGIAAMQELQKEEHSGSYAGNNMIIFVVLNTASFQLIPTTTAMLRLQAGSCSPMEILPAVWLASFVSVLSGYFAARLLERVQVRK